MDGSSASRSILYTKNLSIGYSAPLIESINLSFYLGELTAIIGRNGIGKSTLLKSLSGELKVLSGAIYLKDKKQSTYSLKEWAKQVSWVQSRPQFSPYLTVSELIALGRHPYTNWLGLQRDQDRVVVEKVLEQLELNHLKNKKCDNLSDGQLQKVFIARALVQDTSIILLDEPTNHLDYYYKHQVFDLLKRIAKEENKCILMATHELDLAIKKSDSVVWVKSAHLSKLPASEMLQKDYLSEFSKESP